MYRDIFRLYRCIIQYTANDDIGVAMESGPIHLPGLARADDYWQNKGISKEELHSLADEKAKNPNLSNNRIYELLAKETSIPKSTIRDNITIKR